MQQTQGFPCDNCTCVDNDNDKWVNDNLISCGGKYDTIKTQENNIFLDWNGNLTCYLKVYFLQYRNSECGLLDIHLYL